MSTEVIEKQPSLSARRAGRIIAKAQQAFDHASFPLPVAEIAAIIDRETAAPEMLEALEAVMRIIEDGILVRDTRGDDKPDWAIKQFPMVMALRKAADAIRNAKEGK